MKDDRETMIVNTAVCSDGRNLPVLVERQRGGGDLVEWITTNEHCLDELLDEQGAILFRGFEIYDQVTFERVVARSSRHPVDYVYRSTPRQKLGDGIYTTTEYPKERQIPLHNENAYQRDWPMRILFCCITPADVGGQTPLASTACVTDRISRSIRDNFIKRKILYKRNYRSGVDLSWETVFQTTDRTQVELFCHTNRIEFEWKPENGLKTWQICQAVAIHPRTRQELWFNQAHLFHLSSLDIRTRKAMTALFNDEELPRNAYYGDGSPIEDSVLEHIRSAYAAEMRVFPWCRGDVLLLDNMLICHGRASFDGRRKVLAAMTDMFSAVGGVNLV